MKPQIFITEFDLKRLQDLLEETLNNSRESKGTLESLRSELARARIVEPDKVPSDVVTMNSRVQLRDLVTQEEMVYQLVFPKDADLQQHRISVLAPVGTAIIGYRTGDVIEWPVPSGVRKLKIEKVLYQPEAAGDFHL